MTLIWDPSPDADVQGYKLYYGSASGSYNNTIAAGNVTTVTIPGLIEGAIYFFAATAYNTTGLESDPSNEVSYSLPSNTTNQAPTLNALVNLTINENAGLQTVSLSGITSGAANEAQLLAVSATSSNPSLVPNPTVTYTSPNTAGSLSLTPVVNAFGTATITVTVNDGQSQNNTVTRLITVFVNPINQPPTLNAPNDLTINENAGLQTVSLSGITSGAGNEAQTLAVSATSSNPSLVPNPTVTYTSPNAAGSLNLTPAVNAFGTATITVTVNDGQSQNNTVTRLFTVFVNPINQPPTLNAPNDLTINENAGLQTVSLSGITSGAANEAQTLAVSATSSNPSLVPNPTVTYTSPNTAGSLNLTPVVNAFGTATITVTVNDGGANNNLVTRTFTVSVNGVNQAPTLNLPNNLTINQNAGLQTVNLSGITSGAANESQTLSVTAVSSRPALIPNPTVSYTSPNTTGALTFTPVANASGSTIVTVTVNDGGASNNIVTRAFTVYVNAVNQAPTLDALSTLTINENAGLQTVSLSGITSGAANEAQTLTVSATSSNPSLVPNPTVTYTSPGAGGSLSFTPVAYGFGTATITVTVNDGQPQNNTVTRSFAVIVNAVNQPPTLNALNSLTLNGSSGLQTINLSGITAGPSNEIQILTLTVTSSNPGLIPNPTVSYTSPNAGGSLSFTPVPNAFGTATITVTVNDGQSLSNTITRSFTVAVNAGNQSPILSVIANQTTAQDTATAPIPFTVNDRETSSAYLTFRADSSNPALVAVTNIIFGGSGNDRTITMIPSPGLTGFADITILVSDGTVVSSNTFRLSVVVEIALLTNGNGSILPNVSTLQLAPGSSYTFSATPEAGNDFAGWTGSITSRFPSLTLLMTSNLTLIANFIPSPFVATKSTYNGLFYENEQVQQESAGFFSVSLNDKGAYSGRLQIGTTRYPIRGRLDGQGQATNLIARADGRVVKVELRVGRGNQADHLFGRVGDGIWSSTLSGDRAVFNAKTSPAPYAGSYTVRLPGQDRDPAVPAGDGFGTLKVSAAGFARLVGTLADGTKISQGTVVSREGLWPAYVGLYSGKGSLMSWLAFTNRPDDDLNGLLSWIKPSDSKARLYPVGFTNECGAMGSIYLPPAGRPILNLTQATVAFLGGDLFWDSTVSLGMDNRVTNLSSNRFTMRFSIRTGTFLGTTADPVSTQSLSFKGAVLQKMNTGSGFLLGTNRSSRVIITQ